MIFSTFKQKNVGGFKLNIITLYMMILFIQAMIAHFVAYRLGTGKVPVSNPGKGKNFSVNISNWIV